MEQLRAVHAALGGSLQRKSRSSAGSMGWDEADRNFQDAIAWITQQKVKWIVILSYTAKDE